MKQEQQNEVASKMDQLLQINMKIILAEMNIKRLDSTKISEYFKFIKECEEN